MLAVVLAKFNYIVIVLQCYLHVSKDDNTQYYSNELLSDVNNTLY